MNLVDPIIPVVDSFIPIPENAKPIKEAQIPLVDTNGRPKWVVTRVCYCLPTDSRPCNLVSISERPVCPKKTADKHSRTKGVALYARNPDFGKKSETEESIDTNT